ncbi:hypothetical protein C8R45DRAFT_1090703 [Mycena sanguinolenta]|nr:hypothetical protein C8R45DRAFT_1090703 [Mycena sanguinolenta]
MSTACALLAGLTAALVWPTDPSTDSAYAVNTFSSFPSSYSGSGSSAATTPDMSISGTTIPRHTAGPLTLTPEDIRRRMTAQHGQEGWRQSVNEVFGALSLMRTGSTAGNSTGANEDDDGGEYLFARAQNETVFAYPATLAPGSGFGSPASSYTSSPGPAFVTPAVSTPTTASSASPFAIPMQPPTMSSNAMLRAYAAKHASVTANLSRKSTAEVLGSLKDTGCAFCTSPQTTRTPPEPRALGSAVPTTTYPLLFYIATLRLPAYATRRSVAAGVSALYPASVLPFYSYRLVSEYCFFLLEYMFVSACYGA